MRATPQPIMKLKHWRTPARLPRQRPSQLQPNG
jgi:hypothetical protein